jgi:hypothetical protein
VGFYQNLTCFSSKILQKLLNNFQKTSNLSSKGKKKAYYFL